MANHGSKSLGQLIYSSIWTVIGTFLAAFALEVFLVPNEIIDGGIIGISLLAGKLFGREYIYPLVVLLNLPFIYLAFKHISRTLLIQMIVALGTFALFGSFISNHHHLPMFQPYAGDLLEIVVIGGLLLGLGVGLVIRSGGCLDGTEILGLLINKTHSISVGNVVIAVNFVIFAMAGIIFGDWHSPIKSLITFFVVIKIMDMVIVGLDEMKSVMIFSTKPDDIAKAIMHELGLGLTILNGRGGFTGEERQVIYLMAERLQLAGIKNLVQARDPSAFIAIENLHEVATNSLKGIARKDT